ncbi:hypothetical protein Pelo_12889 [Pelomyxa schiedti]|nr:hypothetical protein Pelo_12889 [Pelomyxa schiedti]
MNGANRKVNRPQVTSAVTSTVSANKVVVRVTQPDNKAAHAPQVARIAKLNAKHHLMQQNNSTVNEVDFDDPQAIKDSTRGPTRKTQRAVYHAVPLRTMHNKLPHSPACQQPPVLPEKRAATSRTRSVSPPSRDMTPPPIKRCATPNCDKPSRTKRPKTDPIVIKSQLAALRNERETISSQIDGLINLSHQHTPTILRQIQKLNEDDEWLFAESTLLTWMLQATQSEQEEKHTCSNAVNHTAPLEPPTPPPPTTPPATPPNINSSPMQYISASTLTPQTSPSCSSTSPTLTTTPSPSSPSSPNTPSGTQFTTDCDTPTSPQLCHTSSTTTATTTSIRHHTAIIPTHFSTPITPHHNPILPPVPSITAQLENTCCGVVLLPPPPPHWATQPQPLTYS